MEKCLPAKRAASTPLRVVELFAGVGGFHLGLRKAGMQVLWANQWEPGRKKQHAFECYDRHFGKHTVCVNDDIEHVIEMHDAGSLNPSHEVLEHDLVCGGFPCQDYSVARPLSQATGIEGKKGVLWWQINRWLQRFRPAYLFLENVDRLLKSPVNQRGRDFAVMLSCLARLGYEVEWRVVNAADYGFPQKRRRVYIVGWHGGFGANNPIDWLTSEGILAKALPVKTPRRTTSESFGQAVADFSLHAEDTLDPGLVSRDFNGRSSRGVFQTAGFMRGGHVWTLDVTPRFRGHRGTLGEFLQPETEVPERFFVRSRKAIASWKYLKGPKREKRTNKKTGFEYFYTEGGIPFPDAVDEPARTILTGEGGATPSRFKHLIDPSGKRRYRRLTPIELERLNGFPDDWTKTDMPEGQRAFCMGNALVVGVVRRVGKEIARRAGRKTAGRSTQYAGKTAILP